MLEFCKFNKIPRLSREITLTEKVDGSNGVVAIFNGQNIQDYIYNSFFFASLDVTSEIQKVIDKYCLYIHPENPYVAEEDKLYVFAGSRNRWLTCEKNGDNRGFAKFVKENVLDLINLGTGKFYGEWYGQSIQRNYGLDEKRFALFNVHKWHQHGQEKRLVSIDPKTEEKRYTKEAPKCCEVVPILYQGLFELKKVEEVLQDLKENGSKLVKGFKPAEGLICFHSASGKLFKKTIIGDEKPKGQK